MGKSVVKRVTSTRHDLPDVREDAIHDSAWFVHESVLELVAKTGVMESHGGVDGYIWHGFLKEIMCQLWPGLRPLPGQEETPVSKRAQERLNWWLRETGNMVCLEHGLKKPSTWWVRRNWNDQPPQRSLHLRTRAEKSALKVSAHEAGEDREPLPVELKYKCPHCDRRFVSKQSRSRHIFNDAQHESMEEWLVRALQVMPVPSAPQDVHQYLEKIGFLGSDTMVSAHLRDLAERRSSEIVLARIGKRIKPTYALKSRLAEMKTEADVASRCREPGCGAGPFVNMSARAVHERERHPDSRNRVWVCSYGECRYAFYDAPGLRMHINRVHKLDAEDPFRTIVMENAEVAARKHVPVPVEPWGNKPEVGILELEPVIPEVADSQVVPAPPAPVLPRGRGARTETISADAMLEDLGIGPPASTPSRLPVETSQPGALGEIGDLLRRAADMMGVVQQEIEDLRAENTELKKSQKKTTLRGLKKLLEELEEDDG